MSNHLMIPEVDGLAPWLSYLVGAYPKATVNPGTFFVFEDQFGEEPPETMLTAVRRLVSRRIYATFPQPGELRQIVDSIKYEEAQGRPSPPLSAARAALLERGYRGELDPAEWLSLYDRFISNGRPQGAEALLLAYERLSGDSLEPRGATI